MHHNAKFDWTPHHQAAFISLKGALKQTPILQYPDLLKQYIAYMMPLKMPVVFNHHRNIMARNYQLHSSHMHIHGQSMKMEHS